MRLPQHAENLTVPFCPGEYEPGKGLSQHGYWKPPVRVLALRLSAALRVRWCRAADGIILRLALSACCNCLGRWCYHLGKVRSARSVVAPISTGTDCALFIQTACFRKREIALQFPGTSKGLSGSAASLNTRTPSPATCPCYRVPLLHCVYWAVHLQSLGTII